MDDKAKLMAMASLVVVSIVVIVYISTRPRVLFVEHKHQVTVQLANNQTQAQESPRQAIGF